jgi:hypothetical protein
MESSNLDVAEAAMLLVCRIAELVHRNPCLVPSVLRHFLKHGVIQALLRNLSCDSSPLFQRTVDALWEFSWVMEPPLAASTLLHLIHLLPSLQHLPKKIVISAIDSPILYSVDPTCLDPSIPRLLLQLARDEMDSLDVLKAILELICFAISERGKLCEPFRAAGAESFLADPQLLSRMIELGQDGDSVRAQIQSSLDLLGESDSDSSD